MNSAGPIDTEGTPDNTHDVASLAASLEQLTSGWIPAPGVPFETLTAARHGLAASLLAGKTLAEIHAVTTPVNARPPANPQLAAELLQIATATIAQPAPRNIGIVRSSLAATQASPMGRPDWVRGARIVQSYGPFQDLQGVVHWVDFIQYTLSIPFAFGSASSPFGVFPYHGLLFPPPSPSSLSLGQGSIWFLANLLSSALPGGAFTGFTITGGTLKSSVSLSYQNGVYVAPIGAILTVEVSLAPLPIPVPSGNPGADAAAAVFAPPASVTIVFQQSGASFEAVADSTAHAYGSTITLHWSKNTPVQVTGLPSVLIPCGASPNTFGFDTVQSTLFTPSGQAKITAAGWSLPLAVTSISSLPEAAGPGAAALAIHTGSSIGTAVEPSAVPVTTGIIEIGTGGLYLAVFGKAKPVGTTYQIWPQAAPSKLNATIEFSTLNSFLFVFVSTPAQELLFGAGEITAFLDRPLSAMGSRFPYQAGGVLLLDATKAATYLFLLANRADKPLPITSIALENALLGVDDPTTLVLFGTLQGHAILKCAIGLYFRLRWLLPTLPDPYAANFDLSLIPPESEGGMQATLLAVVGWDGGSTKPALAFELLPPANSAGTSGTPFPSSLNIQGDVLAQARSGSTANPALLDLSTRVDLFGVALFPSLAQLIHSPDRADVQAHTKTPAPPLALTGMSLALNGALSVSFALPQVSWEPMESTAPDEPGPIFCDPPSDGLPLLLTSPNDQQLVPFSPGPLLLNNVKNVYSGIPFGAIFSLPFGLNAVIIQPNHLVSQKYSIGPSFLLNGGQFHLNRPQFPESFVPNPTPPIGEVAGAVQLTIVPQHPNRPDAAFPGFTEVDAAHGPYIGASPNGYGYTVLGPNSTSGVGLIFENQFGLSGTQPSVPLSRIDFSGYGASIFSDWNKPEQIPPAIIKVQFDASIGRTSYEVIKAASVIYPYCIRVVRTVTMLRQNAGWVKRSDTGWQPASQGQFQFPPDPTADWTDRVHTGALAGVFNVRNIREQLDTITVPNPSDPTTPFLFKKVLFDGDLGVSPSLRVVNGGFSAAIQGITNPPVLVVSRDMIGYLQIQPDSKVPDPYAMSELLRQAGPLNPAIACTIEAGASNGLPGTTLRCSAFQTNIITAGSAGPTPALGVALMGAPQIPRGGGWSMGQRRFTDPAPSALPNDFPVPVVQPAGVADFWYMSDITDILQLLQPANFYSLMHTTGTNKVLFESPQIPTAATTPGLQFPKPTGAAKPGGVPLNSGSPNLGDLASILNSTGLFPDIANALSVIQGSMEQINTIGQGFHYSKAYPFTDTPKTTLIDLGVIRIDLQYADTTKPGPLPAQLTYTVDSSATPSWSLSVGTLSFLVTVPVFGSSPVITITGGFYADEHTKAGLTNLNVQMGDALSTVKSVFSHLQALAQFLPGGAGANLDVAVSNGAIIVRDSFTIGDLPLGLGDLTDISLDLGLSVQLSPLSVDFIVGIGNPGNPFNWIVSPLAGNGLMVFGVRANQPSFTIQAGIGLGLAIDLGIASGSASVTIAVQLNVSGNSITLMAILSGQASVDVLDGLASASLSLSAALGFGLSPIIPPVVFTPVPPALPTSVTLGPEIITLLASCSVGIHLSICWVVSVSWDGSWQFSQSVTTPQITVGV